MSQGLKKGDFGIELLQSPLFPILESRIQYSTLFLLLKF